MKFNIDSFSNQRAWYAIQATVIHDDIMKWKQLSLYWPFVRGIRRAPVNSPQKASDAELRLFLTSLKWSSITPEYTWSPSELTFSVKIYHTDLTFSAEAVIDLAYDRKAP